MAELITTFPKVGFHKSGAVYLDEREVVIRQDGGKQRIPVGEAEVGKTMGTWRVKHGGRLHYINKPHDPKALEALQERLRERRKAEARTTCEAPPTRKC